MRKIEQLMNVAISNNNEYWSKANTSVETIDGVSYVRLHGNLIAEVDDNGIKLYDGGWQSNTTKSRLNAILSEHGIAGEGVFQKDFQWFIRLYNGTEFFVTEFRSGMRLGPLANSDLLAWATFSPHNHHSILNMNDTELATLKSNYVEMILDGMDMKTMEALVYDMLIESFELYSEDEMIEEIKEQYDENTLIDLIPDAKW